MRPGKHIVQTYPILAGPLTYSIEQCASMSSQLLLTQITVFGRLAGDITTLSTGCAATLIISVQSSSWSPRRFAQAALDALLASDGFDTRLRVIAAEAFRSAMLKRRRSPLIEDENLSEDVVERCAQSYLDLVANSDFEAVPSPKLVHVEPEQPRTMYKAVQDGMLIMANDVVR